MDLRRLPGRLAAALLLALPVGPAVAGGASPPPLNSSSVDFAFGTAVGGTLCRTSAGWAVIPAGSAGQIYTIPSGGGCPTWTAPAGGGNVSNSGTPASGQVALFTNPTTLQGASVLPLTDDPAPADGCVRLVYTSTTVVTLQPQGCNTLVLGTTPTVIPSGGLTLSSSGMTVGALFYAYDCLSAGTGVLSLTSTAPVADGNGRQVQNGNANCRLVGMLATATAGQFTQTTTYQGVSSYFNRSGLVARQNLGGAQSSSTTYGGLAAAVATMLVWPDEAVTADISGSASNSTAGAAVDTDNYIDGATAGTQTIGQSPTAGYNLPAVSNYRGTLSQGFHTFQIGGAVSSGTGTWSVSLYVTTRG